MPENVTPKRPRYDDGALLHLFTYHPPAVPADVEKFARIRNAALVLATVIAEETPESADQTAAIRKVREAVMTANAAIALQGRS